ncbi:MAG: DUF4145 domain-containing protein [Chloroflexi bacterium]|nr:DUF4145 domain-containing protein [Chloroflexota bacterium]
MAKIIRLCPHCNNVAPHSLEADQRTFKQFSKMDDQVVEEFTYHLIRCGTCSDLSLIGGFSIELPQALAKYPLIHPKAHDFGSEVPEDIRKVYAEAYRIRKKAPNAYAGQIRRAMEYLCQDQEAEGRNLFQQLTSLAERGIIPPTLAEMSTLIRLLGNIGVHASDIEVDPIAAELIDEFFRSVVEYVYIAPNKVSQLKDRLDRISGKPDDDDSESED